ncbi:hypothetical protein [Hydrogenimonas sp. SS33]|uniref:hypothetical protein n=1 Tax=Hydrogenimonas leucolamina TaxID=2954236 RepID=UPI00336BE68C
MLNYLKKAVVASSILLISGTVLLEGSSHSVDDVAWDYAADWYDGYNVHPYVKIKAVIDPSGKVRHLKDNATGMYQFVEVSKAEYERGYE